MEDSSEQVLWAKYKKKKKKEEWETSPLWCGCKRLQKGRKSTFLCAVLN